MLQNHTLKKGFINRVFSTTGHVFVNKAKREIYGFSH
jgi:hypothetical protein